MTGKQEQQPQRQRLQQLQQQCQGQRRYPELVQKRELGMVRSQVFSIPSTVLFSWSLFAFFKSLF
jgi:hypothetical protein